MERTEHLACLCDNVSKGFWPRLANGGFRERLPQGAVHESDADEKKRIDEIRLFV